MRLVLIGTSGNQGYMFASNRLREAVGGSYLETPGVLYLVSRDVVEALPARADLLFPDDLVRDDDGQVVGCRALGRVRRPGDEFAASARSSPA